MGRTGVVFRAGARRVLRASRDRIEGQFPPVRATAGDVQLVGLSPARLSQESRTAHRPYSAVGAACRAVYGEPDRPQCAQGRKALGPRAGPGGFDGLIQSRGRRPLTFRGGLSTPGSRRSFPPMVFASPTFLF